VLAQTDLAHVEQNVFVQVVIAAAIKVSVSGPESAISRLTLATDTDFLLPELNLDLNCE
jgi:hypothetical protein